MRLRGGAKMKERGLYWKERERVTGRGYQFNTGNYLCISFNNLLGIYIFYTCTCRHCDWISYCMIAPKLMI